MIKAIREAGQGARSRLLLLLTYVGAVAGVTIALVAIRMEGGLLGLLIALIGFGFSMMSLIASQRWWAVADEAVKEAHKSGWYWGGSVGMGVAGGMLALLLSLPKDLSLRAFALVPGDAGLIATGILISLVLALLGYLVCWAAWWIRHGR